jgi:hypothetical protein
LPPAPHEEVRQVVTDAYYRRAIDAPNTARSRAQAAYVIAGAVATAVVTAGAFTSLGNRPVVVQILGLCAFVAWIVTAGLFMYAVAAPHVRLSGPQEVFGPAAFVAAAMKGAADERNAIDRRQLFARYSAGIASTFTIAAVALTIFVGQPTDYAKARVRLTHGEQRSLSALCDKKLSLEVEGMIDLNSLDDGTVNFVPSPTECGRGGTTSLQEESTPYLLEQ